MARDQSRRPLTDAEIEELRDEMRSQQGDIRAALEEQGVDVSDWPEEEK
jgi:hypothetical protein